MNPFLRTPIHSFARATAHVGAVHRCRAFLFRRVVFVNVLNGRLEEIYVTPQYMKRFYNPTWCGFPSSTLYKYLDLPTIQIGMSFQP